MRKQLPGGLSDLRKAVDLYDSDDNFIEGAVTDDLGYYRFDALHENVYYIEADYTAPDDQQTHFTTSITDLSSGDDYWAYGKTNTFTVDAAEVEIPNLIGIWQDPLDAKISGTSGLTPIRTVFKTPVKLPATLESGSIFMMKTTPGSPAFKLMPTAITLLRTSPAAFSIILNSITMATIYQMPIKDQMMHWTATSPITSAWPAAL